MMRTTAFTRSAAPTKQRGMTLIESLVAAVLLGVIFLGLTYALSRAIVSQRYTETQSLALQETRENMQVVGIERICAQGESPQVISSLPTNVSVTSQCVTETIEVNVPGLERSIDSQRLSVKTNKNTDTESLFGGDGEIVFAEQ